MTYVASRVNNSHNVDAAFRGGVENNIAALDNASDLQPKGIELWSTPTSFRVLTKELADLHDPIDNSIRNRLICFRSDVFKDVFDIGLGRLCIFDHHFYASKKRNQLTLRLKSCSTSSFEFFGSNDVRLVVHNLVQTNPNVSFQGGKPRFVFLFLFVEHPERRPKNLTLVAVKTCCHVGLHDSLKLWS